jgi:hypothetical protein
MEARGKKEVSESRGMSHTSARGDQNPQGKVFEKRKERKKGRNKKGERTGCNFLPKCCADILLGDK